MIKAIFFDIDGTLVSFKTHKIPQSAIDAIHDVRQQGVKVFIATGRPLPFINNLDGLEYDGIMSVTGAYCTAADGTEIFKQPVPREDIERAIADSKENPMPIAFACNDKAVVCNADSNMPALEEIFKLLNIGLPPLSDIEEARNLEVMQVIAFFNKEQEPRIMNDVLRGCDANRWHPLFADCIAKGTSKATGIDKICDYYGVELSETMAFGDGGNDIAMLEHAAVGVAMGNASDEVKQHADIVTDTVDNDGVANILRRISASGFSLQI